MTTKQLSDAFKKKRGSVDSEELKQADDTFSSMGKAKFLATTQRIMAFANHREPAPGDKIVYLLGGFDLFHPGHVQQLIEAKKLGDFLYVGVVDDAALETPYQTLHERVLNVLAMASVDDVIIGAPPIVTKEVIDGYNVQVVVKQLEDDEAHPDAYAYPSEQGILEEVTIESKMCKEMIIERIMANH